MTKEFNTSTLILRCGLLLTVMSGAIVMLPQAEQANTATAPQIASRQELSVHLNAW